MNKKHVLLCGASGFLGRNLFEYLARQKNIELIGTYHTNRFCNDSRLRNINLADPEQIQGVLRKEGGFDVLIQTITPAQTFTEDAKLAHSSLLRAAHDNQVKHFIFLNNGSEAYPAVADIPALEGNIMLWQEKECEKYSRLGRTKFTVIRHSNIYGPYDQGCLSELLSCGAIIAKIAHAQERDTIVIPETGQNERDFLYISDLIEFVQRAIDMQTKSFVLCNVGTGRFVSTHDLVTKIVACSGKRLAATYTDRQPKKEVRLALDSTRALEEFFWVPFVHLGAGIRKTLDWHCRKT